MTTHSILRPAGELSEYQAAMYAAATQLSELSIQHSADAIKERTEYPAQVLAHIAEHYAECAEAAALALDQADGEVARPNSAITGAAYRASEEAAAQFDAACQRIADKWGSTA